MLTAPESARHHAGPGEAPQGYTTIPWSVIDQATTPPPELTRPIGPWDTQSIIFTSGTTGPSKGVLSLLPTYIHQYGSGNLAFVTGEDRFLINMPIFHIGGMGVIFVMLARGGSIAVTEGFSADTFWPFVRPPRPPWYSCWALWRPSCLSSRRRARTGIIRFVWFYGAADRDLHRLHPAFWFGRLHHIQYDRS